MHISSICNENVQLMFDKLQHHQKIKTKYLRFLNRNDLKSQDSTMGKYNHEQRFQQTNKKSMGFQERNKRKINNFRFFK